LLFISSGVGRTEKLASVTKAMVTPALKSLHGLQEKMEG